ncbi:MAG: tetratricopeptide repeat protein, partial [Porphyromonas sp.]|nr:tetratricopeptide repeat protein [Porphyromonas sp.]
MKKRIGIALLLYIATTLLVHAQVDSNKALTVGRNALHFKDYLLSIRYFSSAISASPEKAEPYFFRAVAKHSLGDYIGAEMDCDSCLLRNQFMYNAYFLRGISRHALGKDSLAAKDYEKVLYNNPDHQGALHNSALIHLTNKEYEEMDRNIARLQRFYPQYLPTYFIQSNAMLERQDTTAAISQLEKVKSLDALSSEPYRILSSIYYSRKQIPEALRELDGGIALNSKDKRLYILRGIINYQIHNIREALEDYTQAISLDSNDRTARFNRAQLRMRVGDMNAAIEDYDVVLALNPKDQISRFNRGLLRKDLGIYNGAVS